MEDDQCVGALAALLRDNAELLASRLEHAYVREYPHSRTNRMPRGPVMEWSHSAVIALAVALETNDVSGLSYERSYGDMLADPYERTFTRFASHISSLYFEARHIASAVYQLAIADQARAASMPSTLENLFERAIAYNLDLYSRTALKPGALLETWDLMASLPTGTAVNTSPSLLESCSPREREVVDLLVQGKTNGEIAAALNIRQNTVKNHVARIFDKFGVNTRAALVAQVMGGRTHPGADHE